MLAWNLNRGVESARLFEMGHVFHMAGEQSLEELHVAIGATRTALLGTAPRSARPSLTGAGADDVAAFLAMKGAVEQVLEQFEFTAIELDRDTRDYYHPGRRARVRMDGATVARFGELERSVADARKLRQPVYIAEILLHRLAEHPLRAPRFTPVPRYPAVERDFSFIFDDAVTFERIRSAIDALRIAELRSIAPIEIFRGGAIEAGKYSLLLRTEFQSPERTLRDDEVAAWSQQIIAALQGLGGALRA